MILLSQVIILFLAGIVKAIVHENTLENISNNDIQNIFNFHNKKIPHIGKKNKLKNRNFKIHKKNRNTKKLYEITDFDKLNPVFQIIDNKKPMSNDFIILFNKNYKNDYQNNNPSFHSKIFKVNSFPKKYQNIDNPELNFLNTPYQNDSKIKTIFDGPNRYSNDEYSSNLLKPEKSNMLNIKSTFDSSHSDNLEYPDNYQSEEYTLRNLMKNLIIYKINNLKLHFNPQIFDYLSLDDMVEAVFINFKNYDNIDLQRIPFYDKINYIQKKIAPNEEKIENCHQYMQRNKNNPFKIRDCESPILSESIPEFSRKNKKQNSFELYETTPNNLKLFSNNEEELSDPIIPPIDPILQVITDGTEEINTDLINSVNSFMELVNKLVFEEDPTLENIITKSNEEFITIISREFQFATLEILERIEIIDNYEIDNIKNMTESSRFQLKRIIEVLLLELIETLKNINRTDFVTPIVTEENQKIIDQIFGFLQNYSENENDMEFYHDYKNIDLFRKKNNFKLYDENYEESILEFRDNLIEMLLNEESVNDEKNKGIIYPDPEYVADKITNSMKDEYLNQFNPIMDNFLTDTLNEMNKIIENELKETESIMDEGSNTLISFLKDSITNLLAKVEQSVTFKTQNDVRFVSLHLINKNEYMNQQILSAIRKITLEMKNSVQGVTRNETINIGDEILIYNYEVAEIIVPSEIEKLIREKLKLRSESKK